MAHNIGEENPRAKLTYAKADEIRERAAAGESPKDLAREYGVGNTTIASVIKGRSWVKRPDPDRRTPEEVKAEATERARVAAKAKRKRLRERWQTTRQCVECDAPAPDHLRCEDCLAVMRAYRRSR